MGSGEWGVGSGLLCGSLADGGDEIVLQGFAFERESGGLYAVFKENVGDFFLLVRIVVEMHAAVRHDLEIGCAELGFQHLGELFRVGIRM